jgi:F-type H+-transporting ATPase subunit b
MKPIAMKLIAMKRIAILGTGLLMFPAAAMAAGMPQLDFANPLTTAQVVWGAIIFVVLYILLSRGGLPQVASVLEERAARISADLDAARAAKAKADADAAHSKAAYEQARAEAQTAINSAVNEAKEAAAKQAEVLNARLEQQLRDAEAQIAQARASAMSAVRQVSTETAAMVVARLSGTPANAATLDKAIATAMTAHGIG